MNTHRFSPSVPGVVQAAGPLGGAGAAARGQQCRGGAAGGALAVRRVHGCHHGLLPGEVQVVGKGRRWCGGGSGCLISG